MGQLESQRGLWPTFVKAASQLRVGINQLRWPALKDFAICSGINSICHTLRVHNFLYTLLRPQPTVDTVHTIRSPQEDTGKSQSFTALHFGHKSRAAVGVFGRCHFQFDYAGSYLLAPASHTHSQHTRTQQLGRHWSHFLCSVWQAASVPCAQWF